MTVLWVMEELVLVLSKYTIKYSGVKGQNLQFILKLFSVCAHMYSREKR